MVRSTAHPSRPSMSEAVSERCNQACASPDDASHRRENHEATMRDRNYSLLVIMLSQKILGEIGERGAGQRGERQRAGDVDGGKAETGGEQTVEHAFAKPLREFGGDAVAEHLLHQTVARGHAA